MSMHKENQNDKGSSSNKQRTIEKTYQKKSQLEHILLRPDSYIGSVEFVQEQMWIFDKETTMMIQKEIKYVPGLYKIFDEILVNAADNKQRDPKMNMIRIKIDSENNIISVWNNGKGIPVAIHKEENMYVPTMIFGHLLTSSNYDDEEEKVTGGRNGYGAKLCNIFSCSFTVETASKEYKKCLKQTWANNMGKASEPVIKSFNGEDYTKVTFSPDLTKFKMNVLDDDIVALMSRRAYDIAASTKGVNVYLNDTKVPVNSFKDYVDLYIKGKEDDVGNPLKVVYENCGPRWEVAITLSDKGFQQMSFVNSIATTKGGRHIDHVCDLIIKQLTEVINKKNKGGIQIKPFQIKTHLWMFVSCLINNPTFDSQTKENMTLQAKSFGSKCTFPEKFIHSVLKIGIVEAVLSWAKYKADSQLQKVGSKSKQRKLQGMPKLEDANDAGTSKSLECTLILTEGDSAKTMAVSGIASIGRDKFGIFPLRGKILNVREATHKQILENAEINNLIKILGLQYKKKYETREDLKTLRYGKMMIMTDQDQDGSHIKGLLINFIHHNWPSLLKMNFIEEFITPIVKATKGSQSLSFFSLPEFELWKKETDNYHTYKIKYYKGLGTSTAKEAKEYFENMTRHRIRFKYNGNQDDQNIIMAFSKKCVDQRKDWLTNHMSETKRRKEIGLGERYLYKKDTTTVSYTDFINIELVLFSNYDNVRSIPSMIDGFKPGQRKVLYTCLKRNDKREVKVAQLSGSVAEHSAYHHGEVSLQGTIINLAQNFVGSNNINLLQPIGQFGTRLAGGKDSASPRYIFTMLSPLTRFIFHKHDDPLLKHEYDDNQKIEPVHYVPIIPMVLVNGADGIGTGWMTKIPNYDPREIIENLQRMMEDADPKPMSPHYKNFKGSIESCGEFRYVISGEISIIAPNKIEITELPIGVWTQVYKETVLEPMLHGTEKSPPIITDYKEYNTDTEVHFIVFINRDKLVELQREGLHKVFKLQTIYSITSMCAFDENQCLNKYDTVMQIMKDFYIMRMRYYNKRKEYLEGILQAEEAKLSNQARFILEKCDGILVIENKKKKDMISELIKRNYDSDPVIAWKMTQNREEFLKEVAENEDDGVTASSTKAEKENFDYLLGMTLWSLTHEKKEDLLRQRDEKTAEYKRLQARTAISLWKEDLNNLLSELNKVEDKEKKEEAKMTKNIKKPPKVFYNEDYIRKIVPLIDKELQKKIEKANIISKDKKDGIKKQPKLLKESTEEKDEFDILINDIKPLESRLGTALPKVKNIKKEKKDNKITQSSKSTEKESDDEEINFDSISPPPRRKLKNDKAKKVPVYKSSNDESDKTEVELFTESKPKKTKKTRSLSSNESSIDESLKRKQKKLSTSDSEKIFDSFIRKSTPSNTPSKIPNITLSDSSSIKTESPKEATIEIADKEVTKRTKKKSIFSSSDSDSKDAFSFTQSKKLKKKSEDDDSPKKVAAEKKTYKVADKEKKTKKKSIFSSSDSDSKDAFSFTQSKKLKKKSEDGDSPNKAAAEKKTYKAADKEKKKTKKKSIFSSSDSDSKDASSYTQSKKLKKKSKNDDSPVIKKPLTRVKKPVSYAFSFNDESD